MNLNGLRDEDYAIAKAKGWHDEEQSDEHWLMLIIIVKTCSDIFYTIGQRSSGSS